MRTYKIVLLFTTIIFLSNNVFSREWQGAKNTAKSVNTAKSSMAGCTPATASTYLELNNVRALIHTGGDMWWDLQGTAKYVIPKDADIPASSLFAGSIWIGGKDVNNQLKIAAMRFRQDGVDYWPGPLVTSGTQQATVSDTVCRQYDRHFVISKAQVAKFNLYNNSTPEERLTLFPEGYSVPPIILEWPAHGDWEHGYPYNLAPYKDLDDNNIYEPLKGDYPFFDLDGSEVCGTSRENRKVRLYGDQTLWWVYNDKGNIHTETNGDAIGMEIHGQAFAFSTNDELNNMTFYNYEIINRSTYTLKDTYFGIWTDADLGYSDDDYVGCDVNRGLGFLYNGDASDGDGPAAVVGRYGANPPAIGVDFFEGPYQDPDGIDNLSNWDANGKIDCSNGYRSGELVGSGDINNGNINGLNFGDGIPDNERWGMRRFIYFNNGGTIVDIQDPSTAADHYNYLIGKWKSGASMFYGGNGYNTNSKPNVITDFMFPGTSDPCGWGQKTTSGNVVMPSWDEYNGSLANNPVGDRRFVQSAGPFVLEPGMVNDITTGIVWARAEAGECGTSVPQEYCSVLKVQAADDKAQKLFEACFKVLDGPDAPELSIIELDQELVIHLYNKKISNNYLESYYAKDPFISCPIGTDGNLTNCDKFYKFQGYQVYQLKDRSVSVTDLHNSEKAMLVYQCDVKDGITQIVNYTWDPQLKANIPVEEVYGSDKGIGHSLRVNTDMFATGTRTLVNHKKYYYMAIAYAYNNYKTYDMTNPSALDGQLQPYKAGRKTADGGSISAFEAIPHSVKNMDGGTIIQAEYGDLLQVTQLDGFGCGYNHIDLEDEVVDKIMEGEPWRVDELKYKKGYGPVKIKVVDPLSIPEGEFVLRMLPDSVRNLKGYYYYNTYFKPDSLPYDIDGYIFDSKWVIESKSGSTIMDTIYSDAWISLQNEQLISEFGLAVEINQTPYPLEPQTWPNQPKAAAAIADNYGFLNASMEFKNSSKPWLSFLADEDGHDFSDWIKSGTENYDDPGIKCDEVFNDRPVTGPLFPVAIGDVPMDPNEIFEQILDGTWAPYKLTNDYFNGPAKKLGLSEIKSKEKRLSNVDIVFTSDKSKWTRCPVIETTDNNIKIVASGDFECTTIGTTNSYSIGGAKTFEIRKSANGKIAPSVDKNGNPCTFAVEFPDSVSTNSEDANFISATGMGWFPGYAIDVETGERLNVMYGESSRLVGENGADMMFNPTSRIATDLYFESGGTAGAVLMGGKHFIYVLGHNTIYKSAQIQTSMPAYDYGKYALELATTASKNKELYMNAMWTAIPLLNPNAPYMLDNDLKIKLRVVSPYHKKVGSIASLPDSLAPNRNMPCYSFGTTSIATLKNQKTVMEEALQNINVVPNPYYGYNEYELEQMEHKVRITNLPKECNISIYSVNGTLIRRWNKNDIKTYLEWDLKNQNNISIAGGAYIIHVDAPGVGEKIVKWFGALRPIDMNNF